MGQFRRALPLHSSVPDPRSAGRPPQSPAWVPGGGHTTAAWRQEEAAAIRAALRASVSTDATIASRWSLVFEYELPLEGGRRPDVVVLAGGAIAVLEFKSSALPAQADIDQVRAYTRDLADYHEASHGRLTTTILVMAGAAPGFAGELDGTAITSPEQIHPYLLAVDDELTSDLSTWLEAPYSPLPTLVEAARRLFRDDPPPHVIYALLTGIPETVELLGRLVENAARDGTRILALITGVPGSGKTLAGLRLVYERTETVGRATFLSGNGPLVAVLQDALKSRAFVRDLHAFIRTYAMGSRTRVPGEHVIVFDEAQRAWDREYMLEKRNIAASEPELLVQIGERLDSWVSLVGLVGEGQEIHSGEEAGLGQWRDALMGPNATANWTVHCPPRLSPTLPAFLYTLTSVWILRSPCGADARQSSMIGSATSFQAVSRWLLDLPSEYRAPQRRSRCT